MTETGSRERLSAALTPLQGLHEQFAHMSEDEKNLVLHDNVAYMYKFDTSNLKVNALQ